MKDFIYVVAFFGGCVVALLGIIGTVAVIVHFIIKWW